MIDAFRSDSDTSTFMVSYEVRIRRQSDPPEAVQFKARTSFNVERIVQIRPTLLTIASQLKRAVLSNV